MEEDWGYDKVQAKFCASLLWFVCRTSEQNATSNIPSEITRPFETSLNKTQVCPAIVDYMTSGVMYFNVAQSIFKEHLQSFWDLIQFMSHSTIYIMDENGDAVTDYNLMERCPFKMSAHVALMDSMLLAYANSIVSIEDIVTSVKRISTFNACKELPFDLENAILLWLNKVNYVNNCNFGRIQEQKPTNSEPIRARKDQLVEKNVFPRVLSLQEALHDGKTLLSIILYYSSNTIKIEDIQLSSDLSEDEKVANIELFRSLCAENICTSVFALRIEDFYFGNDYMKNNFLALLCEIFVNMECNSSLKHSKNCSKAESMISGGAVELSEKSTQDNRMDGKDKSYGQLHEIQPVKKDSQQPHQPLLSKRSRQQLAIFGASLSTDVSAASKDLLVHDLDVKQSFTISSTVAMEKQDTERLIAWGTQESKKPAKISLNFKPDMGVTQLAETQCSQPGIETVEATLCGNNNRKSQNDDAQHPINSSYPSGTTVHRGNFALTSLDSNSLTGYLKRDTPNPSLSRGNVETLQNASGGSDLARDYKKICSMYSLIPNQSELLSAHESLRARPSTGHHGESEENFALALVETKHDLEDDVLSTITEATEPDHINSLQLSANSFLTVSGNDDVLSSLKEQMEDFTFNRSSLLDRFAGPEDTRTTTSVTHDKNVFSHDVDFSLSVPKKNERFTTNSETGMSYTIDEGTLESALASGIPIIEKTASENSPRKYLDLKSSQEISIMQTNVLAGSVYANEAVHDFIDTKASYGADDRIYGSAENVWHYVNKGCNNYHETQPHLSEVFAKNDAVNEKLQSTLHDQEKTTLHSSNVDASNTLDTLKQQQNDIFSSVSYNHWPFIKDFSKNTFTLRRNGHDVICEKLNNLKNGDPLHSYTTWADLSQKNAYFSLEARESRLKQIRERRLNWTAQAVNHETTTWTDISLQRQQIEEGMEGRTGLKDEVPLSSRLAALRMQLQEKRRQFEEEKKNKLKEWRQERTEALQTAFFISFDGKENIDPSGNKTPLKDDQPTPSIENASSSTKELFRKKRLEKSLSNKAASNENDGLWFVDFDDDKKEEEVSPAFPSDEVFSDMERDTKALELETDIMEDEPIDKQVNLRTIPIDEYNPLTNVPSNNDTVNRVQVDVTKRKSSKEQTESSTVVHVMEESQYEELASPTINDEKVNAPTNDEKVDDLIISPLVTDLNVDNLGNNFAGMNLNTGECNDGEEKEVVSSEHQESSDSVQRPVPFPAEEEQHKEILTHVFDATVKEKGDLPPEEIPSKPLTWDLTLNETLGATSGLTPEQQKKKERFIRNRQKKMEEERRKKEAELENKQREELYLMIQIKEAEELAQRQKRHRPEQEFVAQQEQQFVAQQELSYNIQRVHTPELSVKRKVEVVPRSLTEIQSPRHNSASNVNGMNDDGAAHNHLFSDYTGPSAYQKPTGKSNRKIIQNAIAHCCLSGGVNKDAKTKCLEAIDKSGANHFVVLFREGMKFRSVYEYYPEHGTVTKIYGIGPKAITSKMVDKFYRYYSGGKKFDPLLMKDISIQCDGLTIKKELWEKKQGTPSKINSNLRKKL